MEFVRKIMDRFLQVLCCSLFFLMIFVATWQVMSRYIFNDPSTVTEMMLRCLLIWLSTIAIAYVVGQREHVNLTLLTDKSGQRLKLILALCIEITFILFSIFVLIYGGGKATINTMNQLYPMLQIPKSIIYFPLVLSGGFIIIYSCLNCHTLCHPPSIKESK